MGRDERREGRRPPPPARPQGAPEGDDRSGARGRPPSVRDTVADLKPTPVRDSVETSAPAAPAPTGATPEQTILAVDGTEWIVRVRGRGRAGADGGPAPLLVLGFFRETGQDVPDREALVVGRGLAELTPRQVEGAFRASRPPPEPGAKKELFPETASKGRKGDG
jgi:hypothetical protein